MLEARQEGVLDKVIRLCTVAQQSPRKSARPADLRQESLDSDH
jgi:hypothetical protein